ncbi:hypothetical protein QBC40DRAFT_312090 [Triangularia verruculosa]|uniref:Uncharacterized protein n=1 Tax=Triangularia verruculosa TaxID=2587418 RepID=A0AAN7B2C2_9PEZI|nr:hypothetical protein QBC40DRAFT_312090 [Triangularia verruculosa]
MVQYCCGFEECAELEIPHDKKRNIAIGGHTPRSSSSGLGISARGSGSGGLYLQFNNGTIIPPKEVGYPPESLAARAAQKMTRRCDGWEENSYEHAPENKEYYKTFETDIVGDAVAPSTEDRTITVSHARSVERRTTFSLEVGDPWGIVTASVGYEFATTETQEISYELLIPAGVGGQVGYTPVYVCTRGTLRDCDGNTFDGEACTALLDPQTGKIRGEWQIVEA